MTEHLDPEDQEAFARKTMPAQSLLAVSRHLAECPECVSRIWAKTGFPTEPLLSVLGQDNEDHLSYEQLEAWVDGKLSPAGRVEVETHVGQCQHCAADLLALEQFASQMRGQPRAQARSAGRWGQFKHLFAMHRLSVAMALVALAIGISFAWRFTFHRSNRPIELAIAVDGSAPQARAPANPSSLSDESLPAPHVTRNRNSTTSVLSDNGYTLLVGPSGVVGADPALSDADRSVIAAAVRGERVVSRDALGNTEQGSYGLFGKGAQVTPGEAIAQIRRTNANAHIVSAALYQQQGMWADAEREYRFLLAANPHSAIARGLWQNAVNHLSSQR